MDNGMLIQLVVLLFAIIGVGISLAIMLQSTAREFRGEVHRLQDRMTDLDGNLRDRIAWMEGLLGAFSKTPDEETVYRWRGLGQNPPGEEN